jgi:DNA polymerase
MSPIEYVLHPDTQLISCAVKVGGAPTDVFFGEAEIRRHLHALDWSDSLLVAHNNSEFDAMISAWRLGIKPKMWGCTLAMARVLHAKDVGLGLGKLVAHYELGVKDQAALINTKGRRLEEFTPEELAAMEKYNREDTEQCAALFYKLAPHFKAEELWHLDCNIRMLVEPKFTIDTGLLETTASVERSNKHRALLDLAKMLQPDVEDFWEQGEEGIAEWVREQLASAPKFSALLTQRGVEVPMKPSPTNPENRVPALAKTDEEFQALQEHDDPIVAAAARTRLAVKSTLLETRIEAFLQTQAKLNGFLPVPLKYCGADTTGRDSGWLYNPQNLPRVDPDRPKISDALRKSLRAPKGYVVGVADQSGIELRVNHTLWKVPSTMALYAQDPKADLYKDFAAFYYDKAPDEIVKPERQFAKVCIAEGELVLTDSGPKPIETVSVLDLVWDGIEWVHHDGPIFNGVREVVTYDGLTATPDHEVWVEDGRKVLLRDAASQSLRLARTGAGGAPLGFGGAGVEAMDTRQGVSVRHSAVHRVRDSACSELRQLAIGEVARMPILQPEVRCPDVAVEALGGSATALHEPERHSVSAVRWPGRDVRVRVRSGGGSMGYAEPGTGTKQGAGPEGQQQRVFAGQPSVGDAGSEHGQSPGVECEAVPHVPPELPGGPVRGQHAAQSAVYGDDRRTDSSPLGPPQRQAERRVWDLLNAGPRHRFTVSDRLVSNCQLGLGFGSGWKTFIRVARTMGGITLSNEESQDGVERWRTRYAEIVDGWKTCGAALHDVVRNVKREIDPWGLVTTCAEGLQLPSGRKIRYPNLRFMDTGEKWEDGRAKMSWVYAEGRHRAFLTGPKVDENIVQALARDSVFECALRFFKSTGLRPVMRLHDELVYMFPQSEAEPLLAELQRIMRTPPSWWPQIVLWSEGSFAGCYGDAK